LKFDLKLILWSMDYKTGLHTLSCISWRVRKHSRYRKRIQKMRL